MKQGALPRITITRISKLELDSGTEEYIKHIMEEENTELCFQKDIAEILVMLRDAAQDDPEMVSAYRDGLELAKAMKANGINAIWIDNHA